MIGMIGAGPMSGEGREGMQVMHEGIVGAGSCCRHDSSSPRAVLFLAQLRACQASPKSSSDDL